MDLSPWSSSLLYPTVNLTSPPRCLTGILNLACLKQTLHSLLYSTASWPCSFLYVPNSWNSMIIHLVAYSRSHPGFLLSPHLHIQSISKLFWLYLCVISTTRPLLTTSSSITKFKVPIFFTWTVPQSPKSSLLPFWSFYDLFSTEQLGWSFESQIMSFLFSKSSSSHGLSSHA